MNEKATRRTQAWVGAAMILLNVALQISDYHNTPLAILLAIIAVFLLVPWLKGRKSAVVGAGKLLLVEYGKSKLMVVILIGAVLGALIGGSLAGVWWMAKKTRATEAKSSSTFLEVETSRTPGTSARRHINTFTPREIHDQLAQAGPLEVEEVGKGFINGIVDWTLTFDEVHKSRGSEPPTLLVTFGPEQWGPPSVVCEVPLKGHEYLGRIREKRKYLFRVKGVMSDVEAGRIALIESSIEQLPSHKPTSTPPSPTPVEKPPPTPIISPQTIPAIIGTGTPKPLILDLSLGKSDLEKRRMEKEAAETEFRLKAARTMEAAQKESSSIFDYAVITLLSGLEKLAKEHGDNIVSNYKGVPTFPITRGHSQELKDYSIIELANNSEWRFGVSFACTGLDSDLSVTIQCGRRSDPKCLVSALIRYKVFNSGSDSDRMHSRLTVGKDDVFYENYSPADYKDKITRLVNMMLAAHDECSPMIKAKP